MALCFCRLLNSTYRNLTVFRVFAVIPGVAELIPVLIGMCALYRNDVTRAYCSLYSVYLRIRTLCTLFECVRSSTVEEIKADQCG